MVEGLWEHAVAHGATIYGGTSSSPSAGFYYPVAGKRPSLWSLWTDNGAPSVAINIGSVTKVSPQAGLKLLQQMRLIPALDAGLPTDNAVAIRKYPPYSLAALADLEQDTLTSVIDTVLTFESSEAGNHLEQASGEA